MFGGSSAPSIADIAAVTGGGNNGFGNGWGGDGWWVLIILFALFGGWGRGGAFGGNGGYGCGCDSACATVGDIQRGFDNQGVTNKLNGLEQGLSQLGYADLQQFNNVTNGFCQLGYQTQAAITDAATASMQQANDLSRQLADCCCENRAAIAQVRYDMSTNTCAIQNQIQQCCCDLKETMNSNTRTITDQLNQFRMEDKNEQIAELRSQVQALNLAQSQANQNNYLIGQLRPSPVPAYTVANPYAGFGYGCCGAAQTCCC